MSFIFGEDVNTNIPSSSPTDCIMKQSMITSTNAWSISPRFSMCHIRRIFISYRDYLDPSASKNCVSDHVPYRKQSVSSFNLVFVSLQLSFWTKYYGK